MAKKTLESILTSALDQAGNASPDKRKYYLNDLLNASSSAVERIIIDYCKLKDIRKYSPDTLDVESEEKINAPSSLLHFFEKLVLLTRACDDTDKGPPSVFRQSAQRGLLELVQSYISSIYFFQSAPRVLLFWERIGKTLQNQDVEYVCKSLRAYARINESNKFNFLTSKGKAAARRHDERVKSYLRHLEEGLPTDGIKASEALAGLSTSGNILGLEAYLLSVLRSMSSQPDKCSEYVANIQKIPEDLRDRFLRLRQVAVPDELDKVRDTDRSIKSMQVALSKVSSHGNNTPAYRDLEGQIIAAKGRLESFQSAYDAAIEGIDRALYNAVVANVNTPLFPHLISLLENTLHKPITSRPHSSEIVSYLDDIRDVIRAAGSSALFCYALSGIADKYFSPVLVPSYLQKVVLVQGLSIPENEKEFLVDIGRKLLIDDKLKNSVHGFSLDYTFVINAFQGLSARMRPRVMTDFRSLARSDSCDAFQIKCYFGAVEEGFKVDPSKTMEFVEGVLTYGKPA